MNLPRLSYEYLAQADNLLSSLTKSPDEYVRELEALCISSGWSLTQYEQETAERIDKEWDNLHGHRSESTENLTLS